MNSRRLFRSSDDRYLAGVCGGVAEYFAIDPVIVRILWVLSVPVTGSLTFWIYLVMIVAVPLEPAEWPQPSPWAPGGAPVGAPSYTGDAASADAAAGTSPDATTGTAPSSESAGFVAGSAPANSGWTPPSGAQTDWRWQRRQERWQRRAERWQSRADSRSEGRGNGGLMFGLLLMLIGGLFAWHQIDPRVDMSLLWPVALIAFGAILVFSSVGWRRGGK